MSSCNDEAASHLRERVVRDLERFAERLEEARASADPDVWRTLQEDLHRITEKIVTPSAG